MAIHPETKSIFDALAHAAQTGSLCVIEVEDKEGEQHAALAILSGDSENPDAHALTPIGVIMHPEEMMEKFVAPGSGEDG